MKSLPIAPFAILGLLLVIAVAFWAVGFLKGRRLRALPCPRCHRPFDVPDIAQVKRWIKIDGATGKTSAGYTLHCAHCAADFRFTEGLQPIPDEKL